MVQARRLVTTIFSWSKARMTKRVILIGATTVTLFATFLIALASCSIKNTGSPTQSPRIGLHVGDRAPDFTLTDLSGKKVSLSDYRGRPVMINFWYSSCLDCANESATMQRYYTSPQAKSERFTILAVNLVDDEGTIQDFMQQRNLTYPVVMDDHEQVSVMYHAWEVPMSYFIDPEGIIQSIQIGPVNDSFFQRVFADPKKANRNSGENAE